MSRLERIFAQRRSTPCGAVSVYLPAGFPDLEASQAAIQAAIDGGADFIEVGIPFSDPAADGPVIQQATAAAIHAGIRVDDILAMVRTLRAANPDVGLVCMTYANIAFHRGWATFGQELAAAGFDGIILPDVPLEEAGPVRDAMASAGLDWIPLVTPTSTDERMAHIAATAKGFLYVVANVGTTGQSDPGPLVEATVARAQRAGAEVPLVVGFGLRTGADVQRIFDAGAHGAIVGSALVQKLLDGASPQQIEAYVRDLCETTNA